MTKAKQWQGISLAAYARARNVTRPAIAKHLSSGLLRPALYSDGTLDARLADTILAKKLTRAKVNLPPPASIAEARERKARATLLLLADEIDEIESDLVRPALAKE